MTAAFYDELAPFFHLLYADWEASVRTQGAALAALLAEQGVPAGGIVLDAACGIGTQALGLAACGYQMRASDLSAGSITRLEKEATGRGLGIHARVDDIRTLSHCDTESLDALVACDNAIPHLLTDADLLQAFRTCLRALRRNGVAVYSVRDYAAIPRTSPDVRPHGLRHDSGSRFLAVQVWEWDGDQYDLRLYLTHEAPDGTCSTRVLVSRYYAVTTDRLMELMREAGFASVRRLDGVLFQPILVGRKD